MHPRICTAYISALLLLRKSVEHDILEKNIRAMTITLLCRPLPEVESMYLLVWNYFTDFHSNNFVFKQNKWRFHLLMKPFVFCLRKITTNSIVVSSLVSVNYELDYFRNILFWLFTILFFLTIFRATCNYTMSF